MIDDTLKDWVSPYAAPTEDDGFSDAVMKTLQAEALETVVDISTLKARPGGRWRSWVIALVLGITAGLLWSRSGIQLPDSNWDLGLAWPPSANWMLYALCMVGVGISLFLVDPEAL